MHQREKDAVFALLVRQVEAQELKASGKQMIELGTVKVETADATITNVRAGLTAFGIDMTAEKPWRHVFEVLGSDRYSEAIATGKGEPWPPQPELTTEGKQEDDDEEDFSVGEGAEADGGQGSAEETAAPKIREMVLDELQKAGECGITASAIKRSISGQGVEMHDKTVGMTLYRMSKDGIVRREGRSWFIVPKQDEVSEKSKQLEQKPD